MRKSRYTKRALLLSLLSMLVCMAMLAGSTFAWFTDSVSTGLNKIVAGNLDVKLEYSTDMAVWIEVDQNKKLFGEEEKLWEPGHTEVVYLKVSNEGTLALKYELGVNVAGNTSGQTAAGDKIDLSQFIKAGIAETNVKFENRAAACAAVEASAQWISAGDRKEGHLAAGNTQTLALVVYMPEDIGNAANHDGVNIPEIQMGVNLSAAQDTVERDSFDEQYDKEAVYPVNSSSFADMLEKGGNLALTEDVKITTMVANPTIVDMAPGTVLDMGGKEISSPNMGLILQGKDVTIKNGNFSVLNGGSYGLFVGDNGETDNVVIENVIMHGGINVFNASNVILRNCEIHGTDYRAVWADLNAQIIIESGTYYKGAVNTLQASEGDPSQGAPAGSIIVKGGSFSDDPSVFVDLTLYDVTYDSAINMYVVTPKN